MLTQPELALQHITKKGIKHMSEQSEELKRIANALEEILRLVKADQEKMERRLREDN